MSILATSASGLKLRAGLDSGVLMEATHWKNLLLQMDDDSLLDPMGEAPSAAVAENRPPRKRSHGGQCRPLIPLPIFFSFHSFFP
jgi:hypothetical protein